MSSTAQLLRSAGLRATTPRQLILRQLEQAKRPVSVEHLWGKLKAKIDRVTVYRSADALARAGLLQTVDLGHGHVHYELNDPKRHHHHLVCESCGNIQDVTVAEEQRVIAKLERRHKFKTRSHSFEVFGLCADCQL